MAFNLFTSESVTEGHPDKISDIISDSILDAHIKKDKDSRIACETIIKNNTIMIAGEITSKEIISYHNIVKQAIIDIGYTDSKSGFDVNSFTLINVITSQSPELSKCVNPLKYKYQGAGDQGMMFGYACNETHTLMPLPIYLAHRLSRQLADVRKTNIISCLRPDGKTQVTVGYKGNQVSHIDTIVISAQHDENINLTDLRERILKYVINPIIPENLINSETKIHINANGKFTIGGPACDCGLTGRKIIVDTYGGVARHGGGAFSGKDPSKVDRSGSYAARYVAKNIVASGIATQCEVQVSYALGLPNPVSINIDTFGTNQIDNDKINSIAKQIFDLRPYSIINHLDLLRPIYKRTACYGHFGRDDIDLPWERTDKVNDILKLIS